jgi:hypothetical protein
MRCLLIAPSTLGRQKKEVGSNCPSTAYQLDHQNYQGNDQQQVDVPRDHVESDETDQPKYQQHQENSPKHCLSPHLKVLLRCTLVHSHRTGLPYYQN